MRRDDVASTLVRRHFGTKCPLGIVIIIIIAVYYSFTLTKSTKITLKMLSLAEETNKLFKKTLNNYLNRLINECNINPPEYIQL